MVTDWAHGVRAFDVEIGHIGGMPSERRYSGEPDAVRKCWHTGWERDDCIFRRLVGIEWDIQGESGWDRVVKCDGARVEHGPVDSDCGRAGWGELVRDDELGFRYVSAVSRRAWLDGDPALGDDRGRACWQRVGGGVDGGQRSEQHDAEKSRCDRVGKLHCARVECWACRIHGPSTNHEHRVRADGVGVGYVCAVPGRAWGDAELANACDKWSECGEREHCVFERCRGVERAAASERGRDRVWEHHRTGAGFGTGGVHGECWRGAHRLRTDVVGIGLIDSMPDEWCCDGKPRADGDCRPAGGERDTGLFGGRGSCFSDGCEQSGFDRIHERVTARGGSGSLEQHGGDACREDGVRGDGVGFRFVSALSGRARRVWESHCCFHGWEQSGQCFVSVFC